MDKLILLLIGWLIIQIIIVVLALYSQKISIKKENIPTHWMEADVEFALLETSTLMDSQDTVKLEGLPLALILDGKVQDDNLAKLGKTRFWLKNEIQSFDVYHFRDVFFCTINHRGKLFLDKKRK